MRIAAVIADLEAHRKRLEQSIEWTKNVIEGVNRCRHAGQIEFTNVGFVFEDTTSTGIALHLPTSGLTQDVHVTTIICTPSDEELSALVVDEGASVEALRLAHALRWERAKGVKTLENCFVPNKRIWQGTEQETAAWMTKVVREWMAHWFENPPKAVYRQRNKLSIEPVGVRRVTPQEKKTS